MAFVKIFSKITKQYLDAQARARKAREKKVFVYTLKSEEELHNAAAKIQRAWRRYASKKRWRQAITEYKQQREDMDEEEAVQANVGFMRDESSGSDNDGDAGDEPESVLRKALEQGRSAEDKAKLLRDIELVRQSSMASSLQKAAQDREKERKKGGRKKQSRRHHRHRHKKDAADDTESEAERTKKALLKAKPGANEEAAAKARQLTAEETNELRELELDEDLAAARSQSEVFEVPPGEEQKFNVAAMRVQALVRVMLAKRLLRRLKARRDAAAVQIDEVDKPKYAAAAVVVQRTFRAVKRRRARTKQKLAEETRGREERLERLRMLRGLQEAQRNGPDVDSDEEKDKQRLEVYMSEMDEFEMRTIDVGFRCFAGSRGTIATRDLGSFLKTIGQEHESQEELDHMVLEMDPAGTGRIGQDEFKKWYVQRKTLFTPSSLVDELFGMFDADHNGFINPTELHQVMTRLKTPITVEEAHQMVQMLDTNNDGQVSLGEFREVALHSL